MDTPSIHSLTLKKQVELYEGKCNRAWKEELRVEKRMVRQDMGGRGIECFDFLLSEFDKNCGEREILTRVALPVKRLGL